ncbi:acyl-CoA thioesterase [Xanthobacter albus]|uniref:acyl-CoA thioesterase n=1 Tax=Xanthobacter albus TaxID=3119929 RepID=UPI00372D3C23
MTAPAAVLPRAAGAGAAPGPDQTSFVEMVFPEQANHYGTLFGGNALSLMGKAAFVAATRRARAPVVMARAEKTDFHEPVRVGEIVEVNARVIRVGRASMTVEVEMTAEALVSGARRLAVRGAFEMVAVDAAGRPVPVPSPIHQDEDQRP